MRRALGLVFLLTGVALGLAWQKFQPPDKSFIVDFPGAAQASPGNTDTIFMWGVNDPGKWGYAAGYGVLPGFGKTNAKQQAQALDGVIAGMTGRLTNVKRSPGPGGAVDVAGNLKDNGVEVKLRVVPAASTDRVYLLMTTGTADVKRFHRSFKIL